MAYLREEDKAILILIFMSSEHKCRKKPQKKKKMLGEYDFGKAGRKYVKNSAIG